VQGVGLHDHDTPQIDPPTEVFGEDRVAFDRDHPAGAFVERSGHRSGSGADLDDEVVGSDAGSLDELAREDGAVEEMLTVRP